MQEPRGSGSTSINTTTSTFGMPLGRAIARAGCACGCGGPDVVHRAVTRLLCDIRGGWRWRWGADGPTQPPTTNTRGHDHNNTGGGDGGATSNQVARLKALVDEYETLVAAAAPTTPTTGSSTGGAQPGSDGRERRGGGGGACDCYCGGGGGGVVRVHPIDLEEDPAVVAGLLILYLKVLPHPVVPPKFFITVASLTAMKNTHDKLSQLRIFIHKLPPVCRAIVFQLISLFSEARLPPDHITQVFGPSILSPTVEPCGIAPCEYLNLHLEMPILDKEAESEAPDDFKLQAVVLFEFTSTEPNHLTCEKNDHLSLIDVFPDNWLYAKVDQTNKEGLVPSGHIEMRPVNRW